MALIKSLPGRVPVVAPTARVAENASLIGSVRLEEGTSVWYGAVLRGDTGGIVAGRNCSIQDLCMFHGHVVLGDNCIIGHSVTLHHCTLGDGCLIGMGATVLSNAVVGKGSIVAAGALVPEGFEVPPGTVVMGVPARVVRPVTEAEQAGILQSAQEYVKLAAEQLLPVTE